MDSPLGANDGSNGGLNDDERAALAAWADDDDEPSDAFTEKVLGAAGRHPAPSRASWAHLDTDERRGGSARSQRRRW